MFRRILVPVELSDKDLRAVDAARSLAKANEQGDTEVALLHVIETLDLPFEELEDFYGKLESRERPVQLLPIPDMHVIAHKKCRP